MKTTIKELRGMIASNLNEAVCPSCGTGGAYHGFTSVECPNARCVHYKKSSKPAGKLAPMPDNVHEDLVTYLEFGEPAISENGVYEITFQDSSADPDDRHKRHDAQVEAENARQAVIDFAKKYPEYWILDVESTYD